ncbi:hypothetical protein ACFV90_21760 [Streptomyces sp. NPDC059904]|uniref:hypothetical protein n=1 Tax=Streptomyces sp. NPDC059904 TaxID=3346996 RepID=UPI00366962A8
MTDSHETGNGTKLWYHCCVVNTYGHDWTYGRMAGTNASGWMSHDNLTDRAGRRSAAEFLSPPAAQVIP